MVYIIGGGAAGLMAAARISELLPVTVLERGEKPGKKIYITGKGRCNLTNLCDAKEFLKSVTGGGKFLTGCINRFPPQEIMDYFEGLGLPLTVERGDRVFPVSQKASDVTKSLVSSIERNGGKIITDCFVKDIKPNNQGFNIITTNPKFPQKNTEFHADILILATGGKSYPATGSDGFGYTLCSRLGHKIIPPVPSLVPFVLQEDVKQLEGLSLKNVTATVAYDNKKESQFGEMLFTHNGVSGPIILSLSALTSRAKSRTLSIDLKPALDVDTLDKRLISDFNANLNRNLKNSLDELLPKSMIPYIIEYAGLDGEKKINVISRAERFALLDALKNLTFNVKESCGFNEAVITAGGVALDEINPKTMQSKLHTNLYIIGELLDIDAFTGGFNLQLAWSTACAASEAVLNAEEAE